MGFLPYRNIGSSSARSSVQLVQCLAVRRQKVPDEIPYLRHLFHHLLHRAPDRLPGGPELAVTGDFLFNSLDVSRYFVGGLDQPPHPDLLRVL